MPCTTLLAGRLATCDGSTMAARNDDSGSGHFVPKKMRMMLPEEQPRVYRSVISHVSIPLPENPMRYSMIPNALPEVEGMWAAAGINACHVAMTATETITSNPAVQAADPLVVRKPASGDTPEVPGGIGEEDLVMITLPYIKSAREGVLRVGALLEQYGTYEMNGMAFQDAQEVWYLETIGGHHWIARRVPDDAYVVVPNQLSLDSFDLEDALHEGREHLCSADLDTFIKENHLNVSKTDDGCVNVRRAFGSHSDHDRAYNTARAWYVQRCLGAQGEPECGPEADDIPWAAVPDHLITVEDVKYVLSSHFQGTPFDPYDRSAPEQLRGKYRPIGINRNDFMSLTQIRPDKNGAARSLEWVCFGSNTFNAMLPLYPQVNTIPDYLSNTTDKVSTDNLYWSSRLIGAIADAQFAACNPHIVRYQNAVLAEGLAHVKKTDRMLEELPAEASETEITALLEQANANMADTMQQLTDRVLDQVLFETSLRMHNAFSLNDK